MARRLRIMLLAGSVLAGGLALAQEPPAQPEEPPVRLQKKNKTEAAPKPETAKPPMKDDKIEPPKKDEREDEPVAPGQPQEDEAEVLQRVAKNVRLADEKLANKELNDGTRQLQEDILKDLDSLIRAAQNPPQDRGGGEDEKQDQSDNSKSSSKSSSGAMGKPSNKPGSSGQSSRASRQRGGKGTQQAKKDGPPSGAGDQGNQPKPEPKESQANNPNGDGNKGGGGGKSMDGPNKNADLYKDVWGHLPEALRAEMNAYSNDKQFMAKYDELIKRYYRTLAEQGRK